MIKCLIVDDEQLARNLLEGYVDKTPQLELVASLKNPVEAAAVIQREQIDLLFLDIQMPDLMGTDLLKSLPKKPATIFTTAYKDYALEGYELDVVDYLLKPIPFDRFLKAVNKAVNGIEQIRGGNTASPEAAPDPTSEYVSLKADHRIYKVRLADILYIEGLKEYVTYYTTEGKIIVLQSLKHLEVSLPSQKFMRVHKSYIINKDRVKSLYGNQLEIGEKKIPIGQSYKEQVLQSLF